MTTRRIPHRRRSDGFTLMELLIAMSLLGLIFAALTGGLRFGTQAWQTTSERLTQSDDLQLVYRIIRRQISTAIKAPGSLIEARKQGTFEGWRDELSFVGPAPARSMTPGLYLMTLVLVPGEIGQTLALRWKRLQNTANAPDDERTEPLLHGLQSVNFKYYGFIDDSDRPRWVDEWRNQPNPPNLVRIVVKFTESGRIPWPDLVVPVFAHR